MEIRERILRGSFELFFSYGLKSVTVDDIARHLGISKKTLYLYFANKKDIVRAFIEENLRDNHQCLAEITADSADSVEEIIRLMKHFSEMFAKINPTVFYDMQKYYPDCWKIFREFKESGMTEMIESNLIRGVEQGVFRQGLNVKIISKLRVEQIGMTLNPIIFPPDKFNISEVHLTIIELFVRGITSEKGNQLIKKYQLENN